MGESNFSITYLTNYIQNNISASSKHFFLMVMKGFPGGQDCAPNAGGACSIPGQGTRFHMPQLRVCLLQLKIPHATATTEDP